jgi:hypothetical protein
MSAGNVPKNKDQRQETRVNVELQGQTNSFYVEFADQSVPITNIRDVSVSGVGLELEQIIAQGETIELGYDSDDLNLKVKGHVAWCDANASPVALGIEFTSETPQENMLFFMAMRKYLDSFDGVTIDA